MLDHWVFSVELKAESEKCHTEAGCWWNKRTKSNFLSIEFYIRFLDVVAFEHKVLHPEWESTENYFIYEKEVLILQFFAMDVPDTSDIILLFILGY